MPRKRLHGKVRIPPPPQPGAWQDWCFVKGCSKAGECSEECLHSRVYRRLDGTEDARLVWARTLAEQNAKAVADA